MEVKLLTTHEHLSAMEHNAAYAMLTCRTNTDKLQNEPARNFVERAIKAEHGTILEHITLTYEINVLSRACLQELARHRHISLSVESTRHTLRKRLSADLEHIPVHKILLQHPSMKVKFNLFDELFCVLGEIADKNPQLSNDTLKYYIPEFWPTNLVLTANVRELRHIVKLRTNPAALAEFQELARKFVEVVPDEFKYLFEGCVYKNE